MGRVKSTLIKRTATKIKEKTDCSSNFEENKLALKGITRSKKIRNRVAGYLVALSKREAKEKAEY